MRRDNSIAFSEAKEFRALNENVARRKTKRSAWPRQPRARQEDPPGCALMVASKQSRLQPISK